MTLSPDNSAKKLDVLYEEQASLLERLQIHQRNLNYLLTQKSNYGLDLPLHIHNELTQQEREINAVRKRLSELDTEIGQLLSRTEGITGQPGRDPLKGKLVVDGVEYEINIPYPLLRVEATTPSAGQFISKIFYAGGIELHSETQSGGAMKVSAHLHGRRIAPILDVQKRKLIIPLGYPVVVPKVTVNTHHTTNDQDIKPETIASGTWTVISPASPKSNIMVSDWPQGSKDMILTAKVVYEDGFELWFTQSTNIPGVMLWFYEQGWNVAPILNQSRLSLAFPKQVQHMPKESNDEQP